MVEPRIELEFENLGMRLHKRAKVVLQGVSGESKIPLKFLRQIAIITLSYIPRLT